MAQLGSIKLEKGFGKVTAPCGQRCPATLKLTFQDIKRNITFFAAILKLASRSSVASQILKDLLATQLERTQQPAKALWCDTHMPFGHRWRQLAIKESFAKFHILNEWKMGEIQDDEKGRGALP